MPTLRFKKELRANADLAKVWAGFETAFTDSLQSTFWPNDLEVIRSEGLREGNKVLAEYYGPLKTTVRRYYKVTEVIPFKHFRYATLPPHSLVGGATVEFAPMGQGQTQICWSGEYKFKGLPLAVVYFKFYFEQAFFNALSRSLWKI